MTIGAFDAVEGLLEQVAGLLTAGRSCANQVENRTATASLRIASSGHDHGGFAADPSGEVGSGQVDVFGSQSSADSVGTGCEGRFVYEINDAGGNANTWTIHWDNPFAGSNSAADVLTDESDYQTVVTAGAGNQNANMRFSIFERAA